MKRVLLTTAATLVLTGVVQAQTVTVRITRNCKQVIAEIEQPRLPPPKSMPGIGAPELLSIPVQGKPNAGSPSATAESLAVKEWRCNGTLFVDEQGGRWRLVSGPAMDQQPNQIGGWRLVSVNGDHSFFTARGRFFKRQ